MGPGSVAADMNLCEEPSGDVVGQPRLTQKRRGFRAGVATARLADCDNLVDCLVVSVTWPCVTDASRSGLPVVCAAAPVRSSLLGVCDPR